MKMAFPQQSIHGRLFLNMKQQLFKKGELPKLKTVFPNIYVYTNSNIKSSISVLLLKENKKLCITQRQTLCVKTHWQEFRANNPA